MSASLQGLQCSTRRPGVAHCGCTWVAVQLALQQPASWERRHFSVYLSENVDCGLCPERDGHILGQLRQGGELSPQTWPWRVGGL